MKGHLTWWVFLSDLHEESFRVFKVIRNVTHFIHLSTRSWISRIFSKSTQSFHVWSSIYLQILKRVGRFVVRLHSRFDSTCPSYLSKRTDVGLFVKRAITNRAMHSRRWILTIKKKTQAHLSKIPMERGAYDDYKMFIEIQ